MHLKEVTNNANVVSGVPSFHNCVAANPCATANPRPPSNAVRPSLSIDKHHNSFSHIHERTLALPCLQRFIPYNGVYPKATKCSSDLVGILNESKLLLGKEKDIPMRDMVI